MKVTDDLKAWENLLPREGWLHEYVEFCKKGTDAPVTYHLFNGLGLLGLCIARNAWVAWGHTRLYPNLYICNIGRSSWPHKSTAQKIAKDMAFSFDESRVFSDRFTPEALVKELKGNPVLSLFIDEFGDFVGTIDAKNYMLGLRGDLTELYGCPDRFKTSRAEKTYKAEKIFFSIFGSTTPQWLTEQIKERDILGGFFVRFLFVPEIPKTIRHEFPPPVAKSQKNHVLICLKRLTKEIKDAEFKLEKEAHHQFVKWSQEMEKEGTEDVFGERISPFYSRLLEYGLKISMLLEISEGKTQTITLGKMEHAIEIMNQLKLFIRYMVVEEFAESPYMARVKKIITLVEKSPGQPRRFYQHRAHMTASEFRDPWETALGEWLIHERKENNVFYPGAGD